MSEIDAISHSVYGISSVSKSSLFGFFLSSSLQEALINSHMSCYCDVEIFFLLRLWGTVVGGKTDVEQQVFILLENQRD